MTNRMLRIERRMRVGVARAGIPLGLGLAVALAGCGHGTIALTSPAAVSRTTPVPSTVATYASIAQPVLEGSIAEGNSLLAAMRHASSDSTGNNCSAVGGDLANSESTFHSLYTPPATRVAFALAIAGYKVALGASDECGIASDQNSKRGMKTAASDLKRGLDEMARAETSIKLWAASHHS